MVKRTTNNINIKTILKQLNLAINKPKHFRRPIQSELPINDKFPSFLSKFPNFQSVTYFQDMYNWVRLSSY